MDLSFVGLEAYTITILHSLRKRIYVTLTHFKRTYGHVNIVYKAFPRTLEGALA